MIENHTDIRPLLARSAIEGWTFRFLRSRAGLVLVAAVFAIATIASSAHACFVCWIPYQSLLDKVEASEHAIVARAIDKKQTQWQVVRVLCGDGIEAGKTVTASSEVYVPGDLHVLHRTKKTDPWMVECSVDNELVKFLIAAVELSTKLSEEPSIREQSQYLSYFSPYLEHTHPTIADCAYTKIAAAPYEVLRQIGREMDPRQLLAWIEKPQIAKKRGALYITLLGSCGGERELELLQKWIEAGWQRQDTDNLGALLTAHAELNGEETIRFIEKSYIQNRDRKLGELIAAINTLRVHGQADGVIPRSRIMASFQLLLRERPALVEMIIEDCARWEDWTIAPKLMDIYAGGKQPWNNAMIIKYLEACPSPDAKQFVQRVNAGDGENSIEVSKTKKTGR